ncbi:MAG: class I SAM-dependent methyltransferase [Vulcanimicrobiaceae bacterium]
MPAFFDRLADEYYDFQAHPTCQNFTNASALALSLLLPAMTTSESRICDVGAGRSLVVEALAQLDFDPRNLTLLDDSVGMMKHSGRFIRQGSIPVISDAHEMPFASSSFDLVVSSLGDAYNDAVFWREIHRITRSQGRCIFTTPSVDWALAYRSGAGDPPDAALFALRDGGIVQVPSIILHRDLQQRLIEESGFTLQAVMDIPTHALVGTLSKKLRSNGDIISPIVTAYVAYKSPSAAL